MTALQLTGGPLAVLILAIGVAAFLGAMAAAAWAGRHRDPEPPDLDPATAERIWRNIHAALKEGDKK